MLHPSRLPYFFVLPSIESSMSFELKVQILLQRVLLNKINLNTLWLYFSFTKFQIFKLGSRNTKFHQLLPSFICFYGLGVRT